MWAGVSREDANDPAMMAFVNLSMCMGGEVEFDDGCVSRRRRGASCVGDGGALTADKRLECCGGDLGRLVDGVTMGSPYMLSGVR